MGLEHDGAAPVGARGAVLVDKPARRRRRPARHDLVLGAGRGHVLVVAAALALAVDQVVVAPVLEDEGALDRRRGRVVRDLVRAGAAREPQRRRLHLRLVDVLPERPPRQVVLPVRADEVRVDGVVWLVRARLDACRAVVRPRPHVERRRGRYADRRVLRSELADRVVEVIRVADQTDVRRLCRMYGQRMRCLIGWAW